MRTTRRSVAALLLATTLWGASSAFIAAFGTAGFASASPVAAGGALAVLFLATLRGEQPWRIFTTDIRLYMYLGALEAVNLALYSAALRMGPLPVVVALHLTAPVMIICAAVAKQRRRMNWTAAVELVLVICAIVLVTGRPPNMVAPFRVLLSCALALGSAGCVALLITTVARESRYHRGVSSAGFQLATAAILGLPLVAVTPPSPAVSVELIVVGAIFLGPGFVVYWWALRTIDSTVAGMIGLNEAVSASVIGAVLIGGRPTVPVIGAGFLVLIAVGLEARTASGRGVPQRRTRCIERHPCRRWEFRPHC
ncbi:DMT family transporter [Nocardia aurantia]|uniref:EamA family transporter n=1 Tax=Nocardia aurantia TaxID=2585199 RepID=A0A7K0E1W4_9NOCA|nr:DMT family transporter [Nocardia aurantia]MQY31392.1 hypothetical protein [Nocardia aurantia]